MSDDQPVTGSPDDDLIGREIGQYKIIRELGRGGMATVFLAEQVNMKRQVAIKILPRAFLHDPQFIKRFQREVEVIAELEHPHILPVHDFGEYDQIPYIVMRYLGGGSLLDALDEGLPALPDLARPLEQICAALDYAHAEGIIHRDIKPSNIMLDERGNAYLSDFGIAQIMQDAGRLTGSAVIGTPAYMSPEQAEGRPLDARSDVYSLGVVLFELVTGREPYQADTPMAMLLKQISEPMPSPRLYRPDLPKIIDEVILRATLKDPAGRYPSASAFAAAYRDALQKATQEEGAGRLARPAAPDDTEMARSGAVVADSDPAMPDAYSGPTVVGSSAPPTAAPPVIPRPAMTQTPTAPAEEGQTAPAVQPGGRGRGLWFVLATVVVLAVIAGSLLLSGVITVQMPSAGQGAAIAATATPVPPTVIPPTEVPPTEVPPTEVPPTAVPPTDVPPTEVPPTEVPPTEVPPTDVPPTERPPTDVPPTEEPQAIASLPDLPPLRLGLVLQGGDVADGSFNQSAWEGIAMLAEHSGGVAEYIVIPDGADPAAVMSDYAADYDVVLVTGFGSGKAIADAARNQPDTHFIAVDQAVAEVLPNLTYLLFHEEQAGYLAGVLAAGLSESGVVAGLYGSEQVGAVVRFAEGFETGARDMNPGIEVLTIYHPGEIGQTFNDPDWGAATAAEVMEQGADVVFTAAGGTGIGGLIEVANRASEGGRMFCIGVDVDQWQTVPEARPCLVSSAMKNVPVGIAQVVALIAQGEQPVGEFYGPAELAPFYDFMDAVPEEVLARLEQATAEMTGGGMAEAAPEMGENVLVVRADGPLMLGLVVGLSGPDIVQWLGTSEVRGVEMALADRPSIIVDGREFTVEVDVQDAGCSAEGGEEAASLFGSGEHDVAAVVGHACSVSCDVARGIYEGLGLTMVSPSCTMPHLTEGGSLAFNRVIYSDAMGGVVAADFIVHHLGMRRVAIVYDDSPVGESVTAAMAATLEQLGGEIVAEQRIDGGGVDYRALLEELIAADPEAVFYGGILDNGVGLVLARAEMGLEGLPLVSMTGLMTDDLIAAAGEAAEGVYAAAPADPVSAAYEAFTVAYEESYGEPPFAPFHASTYDAVGVILDAIERVGRLDVDGNLLIDRTALAEAIRTTTGYDGLTGTLTCDETGECGSAIIDMFRVIGGEWVPLGFAEEMRR